MGRQQQNSYLHIIGEAASNNDCFTTEEFFFSYLSVFIGFKAFNSLSTEHEP